MVQADILIRLLQYIGQDCKIAAVTDSNEEMCKRSIHGYKIEPHHTVIRRTGTYLIMCHDYFNVGQWLLSEGCQVYSNHDIYYIVEELFKRQLYFKYKKLECCEKNYINWNCGIENLTEKISFFKNPVM